MGTRHLTVAVLDGVTRVAQYGQWDGYIEGAGLHLLQFLRDRMDRETLLHRLRHCVEIGEDELKFLWECAGADGSGWVNMEVANKFEKAHPQLSRNTGYQILDLIQESEPGLKLSHDYGFAANSLMCEYAYVVDFDKNQFEVYIGFNKASVDPGQRFAELPLEDDRRHEYKHVRLAKVYPLAALPTNVQFVADLEGEDSLDEAA